MIYWKVKLDADKMWTTCKSYFKELYANQKRYHKAARNNSDSKVWQT